jgi:hypothetical protein
VPYFHVVFTLPMLAGEIAFQNKATVYAILFRAVAETLTTIAADPKHLGAQIGVTAVLHTWGQALQHHPHIHCVVPGGGPSLDGTRWIACRPGFFLPVRVLSRSADCPGRACSVVWCYARPRSGDCCLVCGGEPPELPSAQVGAAPGRRQRSRERDSPP